MVEDETRALDRKTLLLLRLHGDLSDPIGPPSLQEMGRDMMDLCSIVVLTVVAGLFLALRRRFMVGLYRVAVGCGMLLSTLAKDFFDPCALTSGRTGRLSKHRVPLQVIRR